jgi:hypothetical protein
VPVVKVCNRQGCDNGAIARRSSPHLPLPSLGPSPLSPTTPSPARVLSSMTSGRSHRTSPTPSSC